MQSELGNYEVRRTTYAKTNLLSRVTLIPESLKNSYTTISQRLCDRSFVMKST